MSNSDAVRRSPTDPSARASDRHALIEQLLLAGLDHYFVGQYEQAIHVWTRVFFLDRGHARARAYIERARCALAERQREAEARGTEEAWALRWATSAVAATSAMASQAAAVPALPATVPRRMSRRDLWRGAPEPGVPPQMGAAARPGGGRLRTHILLVALAVVLLFSAGYVVFARDHLAAWWRTPIDVTPPPSSVNAEPLPLPRASEHTLAHARSLFQRGHLHEALQVLSAVGIDDPLRREADTLLIDVERALLDSAGLRAPVSAQSPQTRSTPVASSDSVSPGVVPLSER
jgi:hypothetical protein